MNKELLANHQELQEYNELTEEFIERKLYNDAATNIRNAIAYIIDQYVAEYAPHLCNLDLNDKTIQLFNDGYIDNDIKNKWDETRRMGNKGAHRDTKDVTEKEIADSYKLLCEIEDEFLLKFPEPSKKEIPEKFRKDKYVQNPIINKLGQYKCVFEKRYHGVEPNVWYHVSFRFKNNLTEYFDAVSLNASATYPYKFSCKRTTMDKEYRYYYFDGKTESVNNWLFNKLQIIDDLSSKTEEELEAIKKLKKEREEEIRRIELSNNQRSIYNNTHVNSKNTYRKTRKSKFKLKYIFIILLIGCVLFGISQFTSTADGYTLFNKYNPKRLITSLLERNYRSIDVFDNLEYDVKLSGRNVQGQCDIEILTENDTVLGTFDDNSILVYRNNKIELMKDNSVLSSVDIEPLSFNCVSNGDVVKIKPNEYDYKKFKENKIKIDPTEMSFTIDGLPELLEVNTNEYGAIVDAIMKKYNSIVENNNSSSWEYSFSILKICVLRPKATTQTDYKASIAVSYIMNKKTDVLLSLNYDNHLVDIYHNPYISNGMIEADWIEENTTFSPFNTMMNDERIEELAKDYNIEVIYEN